LLCLVIPNSVSEARVFFSARVGVRDLLFLFEVYGICEIDCVAIPRSTQILYPHRLLRSIMHRHRSKPVVPIGGCAIHNAKEFAL
jgi:hypothetical protein